MTRIPPAARQLITEVKQFSPDSTAEAYGQPDGHRIHRTIVFDPETSTWLRPVMEILAEDEPRIARVHGKKHLLVTFVPDVRSDFKEPYDVVSIAQILSGTDEADTEDEQDGQDEDQGQDDDDPGQDETEQSDHSGEAHG